MRLRHHVHRGALVLESIGREFPTRAAEPICLMGRLHVFRVVGVACIAPLLFGYTLGFTSPALLRMELSDRDGIFKSHVSSDPDQPGVTSSEASMLGALANVGAVAGALLAAPLADAKTGRKGAILTAAFIWAAGYFWMSYQRVLFVAYMTRFLTGVSVGLASGTVPMYIAEIAPPSMRGSLGVCNQLGVVSGIALVYYLGYLSTDHEASAKANEYIFPSETAARRAKRLSKVACEGPNEVYGPGACQRIASSGWSCEYSEHGMQTPAGYHCCGAMADWVGLARVACLISVALLVCAWALLPETPVFLRRRGHHDLAANVAANLSDETWLTVAASDATAGSPAASRKERSSSSPYQSPAAARSAGSPYQSPAAARRALGSNSPYQSPAARRALELSAGTTAHVASAGSTLATETDAPWSSLLLASVRAPLVASCGLMLIQQLSGINAVIFYSSQILLQAGVEDPNLGGLYIMAVQVVVTQLCALAVDRYGRRPLLLLSVGGMGVSAAALATFFARGRQPTWLALAALVTYICSFAMGLGALPWLIMGEIFPSGVRAKAAAVATTLNWTCSFLVTYYFASLVALLGTATVFLVFAGVCALGFVFIAAVLPETKGVPLEQMHQLFHHHANGGVKAPLV